MVGRHVRDIQPDRRAGQGYPDVRTGARSGRHERRERQVLHLGGAEHHLGHNRRRRHHRHPRRRDAVHRPWRDRVQLVLQHRQRQDLLHLRREAGGKGRRAVDSELGRAQGDRHDASAGHRRVLPQQRRGHKQGLRRVEEAVCQRRDPPLLGHRGTGVQRLDRHRGHRDERRCRGQELELVDRRTLDIPQGQRLAVGLRLEYARTPGRRHFQPDRCSGACRRELLHNGGLLGVGARGRDLLLRHQPDNLRVQRVPGRREREPEPGACVVRVG